MLTMAIVAALCQLHPATILDNQPFCDGVRESLSRAEKWAAKESRSAFPDAEIVIASIGDPVVSGLLAGRREQARRILSEYAASQIRAAFDISRAEFDAIIADRQPRLILRRDDPELSRSRFDPSRVRVPSEIAVQIRYMSPGI